MSNRTPISPPSSSSSSSSLSATPPSASDLVNNLLDAVRTESPPPSSSTGSQDSSNSNANVNGAVRPPDVNPTLATSTSPPLPKETRAPVPSIAPTPSTVVPSKARYRNDTQKVTSASDKKEIGAGNSRSSGGAATGVTMAFGALVVVMVCVYVLRARKRRKHLSQNNLYTGAPTRTASGRDEREFDSDMSMELPPLPQRISIFSQKDHQDSDRYASEDSVFHAKAEISPKRMSSKIQHVLYATPTSFDLNQATKQPDVSPEPSLLFRTTATNASLIKEIQSMTGPVQVAMGRVPLSKPARDTDASCNSLHDSTCGDWQTLEATKPSEKTTTRTILEDQLLESAPKIEPTPALAPVALTMARGPGKRPPPPPPPMMSEPVSTEFRLTDQFRMDDRGTMKRLSDMSATSSIEAALGSGRGTSQSICSTTSSSALSRAGSLIECIELEANDGDTTGKKEIEI